MAKPEPETVLSDDCAVGYGDDTIYPHAGEWVKVFVHVDATQAALGARIQRRVVDMRAIADEAGKEGERLLMLDAMMSDLRAFIARNLVTWNWTDLAGRALPQPDGTEEPLIALSEDELGWLMRAIQGQTATQRKNGSRPSVTTSSDTESARTTTKSSTGGRSRLRAS